MITIEQFRDMLRRVLKKSEINAVNWRQGNKANSFLVQFDVGTSIFITYFNPPSSLEWAVATLIANGQTAAEISADANEEDFVLLNSLFLDAKRCFFGWDDAVSKIEDALSSGGPIGVPEPPPTGPPEDDIPF